MLDSEFCRLPPSAEPEPNIGVPTAGARSAVLRGTRSARPAGLIKSRCLVPTRPCSSKEASRANGKELDAGVESLMLDETLPSLCRLHRTRGEAPTNDDDDDPGGVSLSRCVSSRRRFSSSSRSCALFIALSNSRSRRTRSSAAASLSAEASPILGACLRPATCCSSSATLRTHSSVRVPSTPGRAWFPSGSQPLQEQGFEPDIFARKTSGISKWCWSEKNEGNALPRGIRGKNEGTSCALGPPQSPAFERPLVTARVPSPLGVPPRMLSFQMGYSGPERSDKACTIATGGGRRLGCHSRAAGERGVLRLEKA